MNHTILKDILLVYIFILLVCKDNRTKDAYVSTAPARLAMVGLIVEDVEQSVEFYRRLGLQAPRGIGGSHVQIPAGDDVVLFVDSAPEVWDKAYERGDGTTPYRVVIEFFLPSERDVREVFADVAGLPGCAPVRSPYDTGFGMCFALVDDPDGNTVLLAAPLDGAESR